MKNKNWLILLFPLLFLAFRTNPVLDDDKVTVRGAEDVYVLSNTVFTAIKVNDFDMLVNFIPDDTEIEYLRKQSTEKNKYLFEELTGEYLRSNTKVNFEKVVAAGVEKGINWSETDIQESKISMCKVGDNRMCEAILTLQDLKGNNLKISFDMIKVQNRWFLFQGIRVKNENSSLGKR